VSEAPGWLYAPNGRLRAAWRLALYALATTAGMLAAQVLVYPALSGLAGLFGVRLNQFWGFDSAMWLAVAGVLLAHALMLGWIEKRPWADVGLGRRALGARPNALGAALGAAAIALPSLLLVGAQQLRIVPSLDGSWLGAAGSLLVRLAPAAFFEELFFRGYPFMVLREGMGAPAALAVSSVVFGLAHLQNPGANALSITMVVLAGVFLGAVLLLTRSLWAATAAHLAWNWTLSAVLHTNVSGLPFEMPDYRTVDAGPDWLTGGAWGPEGGIAAGVGMLSALALLRWRAGRAVQPARGLTAAGEHIDG
jgi:hypothetical protein